MTTMASAAPHPLTRTGRRSRLSSAAAVGGLAVLLSGSVAGHLAPGAGVSSVASSVARSSTGLVVTSVTTGLTAVARTGGAR